MTTLPHVRITASGTLGLSGGNEIWSCAHKVALVTTGAPTVPLAPSAADLLEVLAQAGAAWQAMITTGFGGSVANAPFSANCAITVVKASAVAVSGHDDPALSAPTVDITSDNVGGASTTVSNQMGQVPYSVSVVATFRGALYQRGAAALGRIYLPVPNLWCSALDGTAQPMVGGLMAVDTVGRFSEVVGGLLTSIKSAVLTSGRHVVPANISTSEAAGGVRWQPITKIIVDSRPDTVRRRSNKISGQGKIVNDLA